MSNAPTNNLQVNNKKTRKFLIGCLLSIIIGVLLVLVVREIFIRYNISYLKNNPTMIPASFSESIRRHDYRMAKALTAPELWPQIDEWLREHDQVECPLWASLTLGDEGQGVGSVTLLPDEENPTYIGNEYISIVCPDPQHYYCLEVSDIIVKNQGSHWMVVEVGEIKESWAEYRCDFN